jgi:hypothetical protein
MVRAALAREGRSAILEELFFANDRSRSAITDRTLVLPQLELEKAFFR